MYRPLDTPETIAMVGDWHAHLRPAQWAIGHGVEQGADVFVHAGDFAAHMPDWYLIGVTAALKRVRRHLLFVAGNHDNHHILRALPINPRNGLQQVTEHIWHIPRGFRWDWDGVRFLGLGGAHSVDRTWRLRDGSMWQPEEAITREDADAVIAAGRADVMICHDCPTGVTIPYPNPAPDFPPFELEEAHRHRQLLREVVEAVQPAFLWHGHYHVRYDQLAHLGYGPLVVYGLDRDRHGTDQHLKDNVHIVPLATLKEYLIRRQG